MKAFVKSVFIFLLLHLGAGEISYGLAPADTNTVSTQNKHKAFTETGNDKAVAIEQLTLAEPEVSLSHESLSLSDFNFWSGDVQHSALTAFAVDLSYFEYSASINPSLSRLDLIFPFHLFP